ncbi:MAG: response regulator, partial [Proteobacteria bacterium]|nr:response regulator [Pseudomonadota bacterium]
MKVLIAEDDPVTAKLVERILQRSAHTVTVTTTGVDALARLHAPGDRPYEVLLTDWMMPGMDGIELIRRVRAEVKPAPLIIMATAIDLPTAKQYALRSGADGFLAKPVGAIELLPLLEQAQGLASAQRIRTVQVP